MLANVRIALAFQAAPHLGLNLLQVVRVNPSGPLLYRAAQLVLLESEHGLPALGKKHLSGGYLPVPKTVATAFYREFPALFAFRQLFFQQLALPGIIVNGGKLAGRQPENVVVAPDRQLVVLV